MKNKLLLIRFSALGDVAMVAHLVNYLKYQYPQIEIYLLTKPHLKQIFEPFDIKIIDIDLKNKHKGILGLWKIANKIKKLEINKIADLHGVLRSYILDFFFVLKGKKISIINKERRKKRQLTRGKDIKLKHTIQRYADVTAKLGYKIDLNKVRPLPQYIISQDIKEQYITQNRKNIGIAPFAAHKNKEYPLKKMEQVINLLNKDQYNILIFGGGKREKIIAEEWENKYKYVKSVIGKLTLFQEIALIGNLDIIITMDSGNMHLASLTKTKNITIWGGTHPKMGFTPIGNFDPKLAIIKNIPCQPCSVYGSDKCHREDFSCLYQILPTEIVKKIKENL